MDRIRTFVLRLATAVVMGAGVASPIWAEGGLADRLDALLGQERQSLDAMTQSMPAQAKAPTPAVPDYDRVWLATQPTATGGGDWRCLTEALYFEARGESVEGMFAVGEVILNRVASPRFPNDVCSVVNQGTGRLHACQFSYTCDGAAEAIGNPRAYADVGKVARALLDGAPRGLTDGATHYHTSAVRPSWASRLEQTATIGAHRFYRPPILTAAN